MSNRESLKLEQLHPLSQAFERLAGVPTEPSLAIPVTHVEYLPEPGQLVVHDEGDSPGLGPKGILEALDQPEWYLAKTRDYIAENLQLVAHLCSVATYRVATSIPLRHQQFTLQLALTETQRRLESIGRKMAIAYPYSGVFSKDVAIELSSINEIVHGNPRVLHQHEQEVHTL